MRRRAPAYSRAYDDVDIGIVWTGRPVRGGLHHPAAALAAVRSQVVRATTVATSVDATGRAPERRHRNRRPASEAAPFGTGSYHLVDGGYTAQ
jgi:hypothetical protein